MERKESGREVMRGGEERTDKEERERETGDEMKVKERREVRSMAK
jgi:hypothetical protein